MAGWTDAVFRGICKEYGAGLTCTEMISAMGLHYGDEKTHEYLELSEVEDTVVVQLFGSDPGIISEEAARVAEELGARLAAIDINMGCPARKVVRKGEGSALMKTPELASRIISRTAEALSHVRRSDGGAGVPLTVKFRRGFSRGEDTAVEFARMAEASGADAICIHGRFATDFYSGEADWGVVARVKHAVSVPVAASGDMLSPESIAGCMAFSGADGAMIARGAQGNPWIFGRTAAYIASLVEAGLWEGPGNVVEDAFGDGAVPSLSNPIPESWKRVDLPEPPTVSERIRALGLHARLLSQRGGRLLVKMRTYAPAYLKGMPGAARYRGAVSRCETLEDFESLIAEIWRTAVEHGQIDPGESMR